MNPSEASHDGTQDSPNILDAAAYILAMNHGALSTMALQKLCFIAQGWHLALLDRPLFDDLFEAWASGPVSSTLMDEHRGKFLVEVIPAGNPFNLSVESRGVVSSVVEKLGGLSGLQLREVTQRCDAWVIARRPADADESCVMDNDLIRAYFAALRR